MKNYFDLRHDDKLVLRSDKLSYLLVRLCEEVCPSTLRPINPAMLIKAYEALTHGWSVTNTITGRTLDLTPGHTT
jgi:hypothetical protein